MYCLIVSEYGWPDTIVSDKGPCFVSQEFKDLLKSKSVVHITSSSNYQQANGLAEKYVLVVKNLFKKATEEGKKPLRCTTYLQEHSSCKEKAIPNTNLIRKMPSE